ncbi:acyl-CoA dehydrogenase, partial [Neorhizobium sp. BETTINA12A]|nr:acyl-CoA dehydrogenase [Neorhizobium sp. BETTINA12A]
MANPTTLKGPARDFLDWPFFDESHKALAEKLDAFAASGALSHIDHSDTDGACRAIVKALGTAGLLDAATGAGGSRS